MKVGHLWAIPFAALACGGALELASCSSSDSDSPKKTAANDEAGALDALAPPPVVDAGPWPATVAVPLSVTNECDYTYAMQIEVGGKPYTVALDTGSVTLALAGGDCTDCTDGGVPSLYTPGPSAVNQHEQTSGQYLDTTAWMGEIYTDLVHVPTSTPVVPVSLVSIDTETGFLAPRGPCPNGTMQHLRAGFMPFAHDAKCP